MIKRIALTGAALLSALSAMAVDIDRSQGPIELTGSATLEWGYNIDTGANGFLNSASLSMKIPLIGKDTYRSKEEEVYGSIELKDVEWTLNQTAGSQMASGFAGSVSAKIVSGAYFLGVAGAPSVSINKNKNIPEDEIGDVGFNGYPGFRYGTTFGYLDDSSPVEVSVKLMSEGDNWRSNTESNYQYGADLAYYAIPGILDIKASGATKNGEDAAVYWGIEIPLYIEVAEGWVLTPSGDFESKAGILRFDAGLDSKLALSFLNEDKEGASFNVKAFYGSDKDISGNVAFVEPSKGGIVENLGFNVSAALVDMLKSSEPAWFLSSGLSYRLPIGPNNRIEPSVVYKTDYLETKSLKGIVEYRNIAIRNTVISVTYTSEDFLIEPLKYGEIVARAIIRY